jgi:6-phosphogluconolactonase
MKMDTQVFADIDALSRGALDQLLRIMDEAIRERGRFAIALSGGHTPAKLYSLWAASEKRAPRTDWNHVHLFWGDERYVAHTDSLSNYRMTNETLISQVPIPASNVHPMPGPAHFSTPEVAAEAYESELREFFSGAASAFDLQLLGLGPEGHTASLFPGSPALQERERWVLAVTAPANPPQRLTLTLPVINQARNTFFLVAGRDKREIVAALRNELDSKTSQYPAARVQPARPALWLLDQAAASSGLHLSETYG